MSLAYLDLMTVDASDCRVQFGKAVRAWIGTGKLGPAWRGWIRS